MRNSLIILSLLFGIGIGLPVHADADRESLIKAWEAHIASLPSTASFEVTGEGTYHLTDTDLPYDGELKLHGALVRSMTMPGLETDFTHMGMLEFELSDLPEERQLSQLYYYWLADMQSLYYSQSRDEWVSQSAYTEDFGADYGLDDSFGFMSFMMRYGIWILLIALVIFVFRGAGKQMKKNRALLDDTAAINDKARENVERAQAMQDELLAISRQSLELQAQNNDTLKKILEAVRQ